MRMVAERDIYCIKNEHITVQIHKRGATLWSIKDSEGNEYLWQGNPDYWAKRAPNLFPYIARLTDKKYVLDGNVYEMGSHGFAKDMDFAVEQMSDNHIMFSLKNNAETYSQYPYEFEFGISYRLEDRKIEIIYSVYNQDKKVMYFGLGGHPGFNVPFEKDTVFEDYYLEFDEVADAKRVGFSEDCFLTGEDTEYPLVGGKRIQLNHSLFDDDAIVLTGMSRGVTLTSNKGKRSLRVQYPSMPYLGIWHKPKVAAPYVCIEPWTSLPSRKGIVEDLSKQPSLVSLEPDGKYRNGFTIELI